MRHNASKLPRGESEYCSSSTHEQSIPSIAIYIMMRFMSLVIYYMETSRDAKDHKMRVVVILQVVHVGLLIIAEITQS